tara:strand:+ start:1034 stop:1447 length:414 start_codon:yes stop_codon:yes gene_type:complete
MKTTTKYDAVHFGARLHIDQQNLVHLKFPPDINLNVTEAKHIDSVILKEIGSDSFSLIVDLKDSFGSMSREVQHFFAKEAPSIPQIKASAIIVNNLPVRILVKFYMSFFKPIYFRQIFADIQTAKKWLTEVRSKESI